MNAFILLLRRIRSLCVKELLVIIKDPKSRVILVLPILLQSLIFGYAATYDLDCVPYVVCDQSRSAASRDLLAHLDGTGKFERVATLARSDEASQRIWDGDALLAVEIGPDFARCLAAGRRAEVQVLLDGRNSTTAGIAMGYVESIVSSWNASRGVKAAVSLAPRARYNPQLETRWNFMTAMVATLSLMQIMLLSALSVAREREQGTFDQMLVTPLSPGEILVGKALPPILVGLVQSMLILGVGVLWFGIPFQGSMGVLLPALLAFTLGCSGIGLSVSALSANMQQAMVFCFLLLMPMILLSGFTTPVRSMPEFMQAATWLNPVRFAVDAVRRIYLEGAGLADIAEDFIPMLGIAAVTLPVAGWMFRHKLS